MSNKNFSIYHHLVWATWDRELWIKPDIERRIYRNIAAQLQQYGCKILAINGMPDHIHLLIKAPTTVTISKLVKQAKGVSSNFINKNKIIDDHFKWQIGYGVFTVSRWDTEKIIMYIRNQKEHHKNLNLIVGLEEIIRL